MVKQAIEAPLSAAANKLLSQLCSNWPQRIETHIVVFDIALRRGKFIAALQAMKRALRVTAQRAEMSAALVCRLTELSRFVRECRQGAVSRSYIPHPVILEVAAREIDSLLGGATPAAFANAYFHIPIAPSLGGLERRAAGACACCVAAGYATSSCEGGETAPSISSLPGVHGHSLDLDECVRVNEVLASMVDVEAAQAHQKVCLSRFPLSLDRFSLHNEQYGPGNTLGLGICDSIMMWSSLIY